MIRLDAIPISGLPQVSKTDDIPGSYGTRINCVLHSGQLLEHQELEVRINGLLQTGVPEGDQSVFAWQFFQASDEVQIALMSRGMRMKFWRGCWNERDAILHTGTLQVQVFFNGKPQPLEEGMMTTLSSASLVSMSPSIESVNGNRHTGTIVLERALEEGVTEEGATGVESGQRVLIQDLLVIAAPEGIPDPQQEMEVTSQEEEYEEEEDQEDREEEEYEEEEDQEDREEEEYEEEEDQEEELRKGEEVLPMDDIEGREDGGGSFALLAEVHGHSDEEAEQSNTSAHSTMRRIASFHTSSLALEESLQSLKDLVASMSPKTLIVDVRSIRRPQRKRYELQNGLSKQILHSVFGAKYWDRAWAIQIVSRIVAPTEGRRIATWQYVVSNPDSHPDGITALAKKLEEGYSLVVIDSIATYTESRRRAVIEELQKRVSGLDLGPLA